MVVVSRYTLVFPIVLGLCAFGLGQASDGNLAAQTVQSATPTAGTIAPVNGLQVANVPLNSAVLDANTGAVIGATSFMSFTPMPIATLCLATTTNSTLTILSRMYRRSISSIPSPRSAGHLSRKPALTLTMISASPWQATIRNLADRLCSRDRFSKFPGNC